MANIKFLRGSQTNLPVSGSNDVIDGALYFSINQADAGEERGKLFLGDANHKLIPIGEDIILKVVDDVRHLPQATLHSNEFYYCTSGNILAFSNGAEWVQVNANTDTQLDSDNSVGFSVAADGTVTYSIQDTAGTIIQKSFKIAAGSNNVDIGRDATTGALTISVDPDTTYTLGTSTSADDVNITLTPSAGTASSVKIKDTETIDVTRDSVTGDISLNVKTNAISGVADIDFINGSGTYDSTTHTTADDDGFTVAIITSSGDEQVDSIDPVIAYGKTGASNAHFVNGTATLNVPTVTDLSDAIAELQRTINAMTYRGIASSATTITGATLHNGDVFLADAEFTIDGKTVKPGYLIVVQGSENPSGVVTNPTYDVVKGNDTDTTYTMVHAATAMSIQDKDGGSIGTLALAGGTSITLSNDLVVGTNTNTVTITHANVTRTDSTAAAAEQNATEELVFTVVTGVATNSQGHVTGVTTKQITGTDTNLDIGTFSATVTAANNVATITSLSDGNDALQIVSKIASTGSLQVTGSGDTTTIDLVWGSF